MNEKNKKDIQTTKIGSKTATGKKKVNQEDLLGEDNRELVIDLNVSQETLDAALQLYKENFNNFKNPRFIDDLFEAMVEKFTGALEAENNFKAALEELQNQQPLPLPRDPFTGLTEEEKDATVEDIAENLIGAK